MPSKPPVHKPLGTRTEAQRKAAHDLWRESSSKRGYGRDWQALRNYHITRNPLCKACADNGIVRAAQEVDHVIPHRGNNRLRMDPGNLQSLCKPCHSRKTATEDSSFAKG